MALSPANVVVAYRQDDADSESVADAYISLYNIDASHKIAVPCSNEAILADEAEFNSQVLDHVKTAIDNLRALGRNIWAVVLSYKMPLGFYDGPDVVSSTSRLSRLDHAFSKKLPNILYDRATFSRFNESDAEFAIICSTLDSPSAQISEGMIDAAAELRRQLFVTGELYLDPYSDRHAAGAAEYTADILSFATSVLPRLNLESYRTLEVNPYIDPVIPSVANDSFVWSWFSDRGSPNFFKDSAAIRAFFYNGDYDGASELRDAASRTWTVLAISAGYVSTAGALSNPTIAGMLRPKPFFTTLLRAATIGEAYIFSLPYLDWTMTLVGDPLAVMAFPANDPDEDTTATEEGEANRKISLDLARIVARYMKRSDVLEAALDSIVLSADISLEVDLLPPFYRFYADNNDDSRNDHLFELVAEWVEYVERRARYVSLFQTEPTFDQYLTNHGLKISELLRSVMPRPIASESNFLETGSWEFETTIQDDAGSFAFYHFELEVSEHEDFSTVLYSISSLDSQSGWSFERDTNEFVDFPVGGVTSNYVGNRVRYNSRFDQPLSRAREYYVRIRQRDQNSTYAYRTSTEIGYT